MEHIQIGTLYADRELLRVNSIEDKNDPVPYEELHARNLSCEHENHVHKD